MTRPGPLDDPRDPIPPYPDAAASIAALHSAHAAWSLRTFGALPGPIGALRHLILEAGEAIENPTDAAEYVDCLFLVFDAARRAGFDLDALSAEGWRKLAVLERRTYRPAPDGQPSEHDRQPLEF